MIKAGNQDLEKIQIPQSVTKIGDEAFKSCKKLKGIKIPDSVKVIGKRLFSRCDNLEKVILPTNIEEIPFGCFWGCENLKDIKIPDSVTEIKKNAFYGCDKIQFIYSKNAVPPTCTPTSTYANGTFANDVYKYAYLYVPTKSVQQYKTAYEWRNFTNIIGQDDEGESPYQMEVVLKNGTTTTYDLDDIKEVNIINR